MLSFKLSFPNVLLTLAVVLALSMLYCRHPKLTESQLQSNCTIYCDNRCQYCPSCSGCANHLCVVECQCNVFCQNTQQSGFLDHLKGCQCSVNLGYQSELTSNLTLKSTNV